MGDMTEDILKRAEPFLNQCGSCDAGLPMSCTCPRGDFRPVMLELVREVERLRRHPSGWQSRFFRIQDGDNPYQLYRSKVSGEIRGLSYDHADVHSAPDCEWEPLYVYRPVPE